MAGHDTGSWKSAKEKLRLVLANRWRRWGDPWELRMRAVSRRAEADMWRDPGEKFYASLYLDRITRALPAGSPLSILDAGCQAGRFAIPLAQMGHRVTGNDISPNWLDLCRRHCESEGVRIELLPGDIREVVAGLEPATFDAVLCTEVLYTIPRPQELLGAFERLLRPGGVLIASHRTRYYMLSTLARFHRFSDMDVVVRQPEGEILGQYFNWFDEDDLRSLYAEAGLGVRIMEGIGAVSGTGVDGLAAMLDPVDLDDAERAHLLRIENQCARRYRDIARYRLVVATHTADGA